ncbi:MAG TPA: hypothetical protein VNN79_00905 [Actinomycetota bacterium]|nr:hypothetical protein [Actinomycetota bacterium]
MPEDGAREMAKFLVLYNSPMSASEVMANASPEEAKAGMDAWMAWAQQARDAVLDLGVPLEARTHLEPGSTSDSASQASGYSILQADSVDAATSLLAEHPHLTVPGNTIDVLELLSMPGMEGP